MNLIKLSGNEDLNYWFLLVQQLTEKPAKIRGNNEPKKRRKKNINTRQNSEASHKSRHSKIKRSDNSCDDNKIQINFQI